MGEIMQLMVNNPDWTMTKVASVAYESKLSKHHNWLTKRIVKAGLLAVKNRKKFVQSLIKEQNEVKDENSPEYTEESMNQDFI